MKWNKNQDIVAYYLFRCGETKTRVEKEELGQKFGIEADALRMRMANFRYLSGQGGLSHPAKMSQQTFQEFQSTSVVELDSIVNNLTGN